MKRKLENEPSKPHAGAPTQWLSSLKGIGARPQEDLYSVLTPQSTQALPWVGSTHLTVTAIYSENPHSNMAVSQAPCRRLGRGSPQEIVWP